MRYTFLPIAETGSRFTDFAPYVAAINDNGVVAFQAALSCGGSGVFTGNGAGITAITDPAGGFFSVVCSHPDLNRRDDCCFYAKCPSGESGVFRVCGKAIENLAGSFGPLGPTINETGTVAFRIDEDGAEVRASDGRHARSIARCGATYKAFEGLPVVNRDGVVAFRAELHSGAQGIYVGDGARTATIAETGSLFHSLSFFPIINDAGAVAFCATLENGTSGVFLVTNGSIETVAESGSGFESFRGVLINSSGLVVFFATPTGGSLGVYTGPNPTSDCVLSIGSPLFGSSVAEFALNPVSVNEAGQLAIRVRMADRRQFILRADPQH